MTDYHQIQFKLKERLRFLQEQAAKYESNIPDELLNQISDFEEAITLTAQVIQGKLNDFDWQEAIKPISAAIKARSYEGVSSNTAIEIRDRAFKTAVSVVNFLGQYSSYQGPALEREVSITALIIAKRILDLALIHVGRVDRRTAQKYSENPAGYETPLRDTLNELLCADRGLIARFNFLLEQFETANIATGRTVNTGGGAYVEGDVKVENGDFIGRNKIIQGNNSVSFILNQYQDGQKTQADVLYRQIDSYLNWLQERCGTIELRGIKREGQQVVQLGLDKAYVPLEADSFHSARATIEMNELLRLGRRIVITGGPGSGKSTVLLHIAWIMATAIATDNPVLAEEKLGLRDTFLDELKVILEDANDLVQKENWFRDYSSIEKLRLEVAYDNATLLAQIGSDDPLKQEIYQARDIFKKIESIVKEGGRLARYEQLPEEFDVALTEVSKLIENQKRIINELNDLSKSSSNRIQLRRREELDKEREKIDIKLATARKKVDQLRSEIETVVEERKIDSSKTMDIDKLTYWIKAKEFKTMKQRVEKEILGKVSEFEKVRQAIKKARTLVLEKKW